MSIFIQRAPAAIFARTFMKTLLTRAAIANQTLMALIYLYRRKVVYKSFENTAGKGEISPFPTVFFYLFGELSAVFIKFGLANQKWCYFQMLLDINKSGEEDQERS